MDNQTVVGIATGATPLEQDSLEPTCRRVGSSMFSLLGKRWYLQRDGCEFVMWRRRCYNKQADHIANVALQNREPAHGVLDCWHRAVAERHN